QRNSAVDSRCPPVLIPPGLLCRLHVTSAHSDRKGPNSDFLRPLSCARLSDSLSSSFLASLATACCSAPGLASLPTPTPTAVSVSGGMTGTPVGLVGPPVR